MRNDERILTLHPIGKSVVRISKIKYDLIKDTMIDCLKSVSLTHLEVMNCIKKRHEGKVEGSTGWYSETVKLDLEARKIDAKPQIYILKNKNHQSKHQSTEI